MLTVPIAAEAVSSGRTGKSDALSKKKTATTWRSPRSRHPLVQAAYGDKYDFWAMIGAKRDVAELLGEEEPRSIRERLRRKELEKERINQARQPEIKNQKDRGWER